jgi:hypothetical protein
MNTSWLSESGDLLCRWTDAGAGIPYSPPWGQETSSGVDQTFVEPLPDFAAHSPLGSGEWFVPWDARWSVPRAFSK